MAVDAAVWTDMLGLVAHTKGWEGRTVYNEGWHEGVEDIGADWDQTNVH